MSSRNPSQTTVVLQAVLRACYAAYPLLTVEQEELSGASLAWLPHHQSDAYRFWLGCYEDGNELQVGAQLVGTTMRSHEDEDLFFWRCVIERNDWPTLDAFEEHVGQLVISVIGHPTRIVQERGALFWRFGLEILEEARVLRRIEGRSPSRMLRVPRTRAKRTLYEAEAVCASAGGGSSS